MVSVDSCIRRCILHAKQHVHYIDDSGLQFSSCPLVSPNRTALGRNAPADHLRTADFALCRAMLQWAIPVQRFFSEHGTALLVCWALSTLVFWWLGGFTPGVPRVPPRLRRELTVGSGGTYRSCVASPG